MAWIEVETYSLGYSMTDKRFFFYYQLRGETGTRQFSPSAEEFIALSDMFRNEGPISYDPEQKFFATGPEPVGEGEYRP